MDLEQVGRLPRGISRPLLDAARRFGGLVRAAPHRDGGLFAVGTPEYEPWHLVAHLNDVATWTATPHLAATLVRHRVPEHAPAHLAVDLEALSRTDRNDTVLVLASQETGSELLTRLADAKRRGGTILALAAGAADPDLTELAHETAEISDPQREPATHLVPLAARGLLVPGGGAAWWRRLVA